MGPDRAEEFGARNGVKGELLVRLHPDRIVSAAAVASSRSRHSQSPVAVRHDETSVIQYLSCSTASTGTADDVCWRSMSYAVDFDNVSTIGLESSPVATALAGLRANEARYFKNKYDHVFTVEPAAKAKKAIDLVHHILKEERELVVTSLPLEATTFQVENIQWTYVFYESGLSINVLYTLDGASVQSVSSSLKGWRSPPNSAHSSSRDRNRSWQGPSAARTS